MRRRLNYTDRERITRDRFLAKVVNDEGPIVSMHFEYKGMELPADARIVAEPHVGTVSQRIDLGTVAKPAFTDNHDLSSLGTPENIIFDIKVVSKDGKILAAGSRIPLVGKGEDAGSKSLLPVRRSLNLGNEIWRLSDLETAEPCLFLNGNIPGLMDQIVSDPLIQGAILVPAVRTILVYLLEHGSPDDIDWHRDWATWVLRQSNDFSLTDMVSELENDASAILQKANELTAKFADEFEFASLAQKAAT